MRNYKKILLSIFIFLICGLCIIGIIFLDKDEDAVSDYSLKGLQAETYTSYSKVFLGEQDLKQTVKVDGRVFSKNETCIEEVKLSGTKEDLKILQGESFSVGDVIFQRNGVSYKAKYKGVIDKVYEGNNYVRLTLVNYEELYVYAALPIEYTQYINEGDDIAFFYMNQEKKGRVSYISTIAENDTVAVEIELDDNNCELIINAGIKIEIVKAKADSVIAIPKEALIKSKDGYYVLVSTGDGDSELVSISIGLVSDDGYVEVKSGLTLDDIVLYDSTSSTDYDEKDIDGIE